MRWMGSPGLRARLLLGLLLTWAVTLAVVALALLQPLEQRLRHDGLSALAQGARTAAASLRALEAGELGPTGSPALRRAVRAIAHATHADAVVVAPSGRVLAASDPDSDGAVADGARALRTNRLVAGTTGSGDSASAHVAYPVRTESGVVALLLRKSLADVASSVRVVQRAVVVAALIGLLTALLLGFALARRTVKRLRGLHDMALRVARLGPVVEVAPDDARDEVAELTRAFATMQDRLREQEEARRTFVSTASHELRTPVASLRLMLELLAEDVERGAVDPASVRDQLREAAGDAERLGRLTEELLDLSRLDAGTPLRQEAVDLRAACRTVAGELAARAEREAQPIALDGTTAAWAIGDPGAVTQILRILLDNALRFGPPGAPVEVAVDGDAGACTVRVRDRGPGVAAEEREAIFERFRRGRSSGGTSGFGLGLAIARELARRMDGDVALHEDGGAEDGAGACFELRMVPAPQP